MGQPTRAPNYAAWAGAHRVAFSTACALQGSVRQHTRVRDLRSGNARQRTAGRAAMAIIEAAIVNNRRWPTLCRRTAVLSEVVSKMRRMLVTGFAAFAGLTSWTIPAGAGILSKTGPVIAILAGDLFVGEAEGHVNGSGTIRIESRANSDVTCSGKFTFSRARGDAGDMHCSDGATATFQFQRLSLVRGYGSGSTSRGPMSFTYGLSAVESLPFLKVPAGKALRPRGNGLVLAEVGQSSPAVLPPKGLIAPVPDTAPDVMLSAATLLVIARLKQDRTLQIGSSGTLAELVEATILPLFDFRHMTQLAVATHWRLASPEQQDALTAGFRSLLVRSYSVVLASYRDEAIEYLPARMAPGETWLTVKSTVKQPGAERMTIDYDMEKTAAGWKVYDIKIGGVSLITTYRSNFAQTIRDGGVDGLIKALTAKNRQPDSGIRSRESGARSVIAGQALTRGSRRSYSRFTTA